jgi:hypothetical protein
LPWFSVTLALDLRISMGDRDPTAKASTMAKFLLWLLLLFFCWPLALVALVLYPFVWLLMLPFRMIGIAVDGVFQLLKAIIFLPARLLGGAPSR